MPIALPYRMTSPRRIGFVVAAAALTLPIASACSPDEPEATDPGTTPPVWEGSPSPSPGEEGQGGEGQGGEGQGDEGAGGQTLTADLQSPDGTTVATAEFDFSDGYATITVETATPGQLTPGFHGLHVHSVGTCEPDSMPPGGGEPGDFKSSGGHFQAPGHTDWPASGDLSNLQVRQDGSAKMVTTSDMFTAEQLLAGEGTSLMIHERASNFGNIPPEKYQQVNGTPGPDEDTLKTGDAGGRVACGAISAG